MTWKKKEFSILVSFLLILMLAFSFSCARKAKPVRTVGEEPAEVTPPEEVTEEVKKPVTAEEWEAGKVEKAELTVNDYNIMGVLKDIHYDFDKYNIKPQEANVLEENARWLLANLTVIVLIEGHCDERGTNQYNLALGERRAQSAKAYLIALGVSPERFKTISYGEEMPVDPGHSEIAWSKNRRAHFLIISK
ncbi:MAG: peptidoglycan-associated lipoprotein Pal [Acidobacteriota bacterium]